MQLSTVTCTQVMKTEVLKHHRGNSRKVVACVSELTMKLYEQAVSVKKCDSEAQFPCDTMDKKCSSKSNI